MPTCLPATATQPGRHARGGVPRAARRTQLRLWLMVVLALLLVFVKSVDLHFHEHIGAPVSSMHLADASTAHLASHGDLDIDIQGESSPQPSPSMDLPPVLLLALALLFTPAVRAPLPRWTPAAAAEPPAWRHRANTPPPAVAPPLH